METPSEVGVVEILGPGCVRCRETYRVVRHVVEQAGLACDVRKDERLERMVELGVLRTPAIAVDGRVVHQGAIPKSDDVRRLLGLT